MNTILASGRRGLEFFRAFGPAYAAHTGTEHDQHAIEQRYDEHGDIVVGPLRQDRERFDAIEAGLASSVLNLRGQEGLSTFLAATDDLRGQFVRLSGAIDLVVDAADRAVSDLATGVGELYAAEIGGAGPDDVAFLVDFGKRVTTDDADLARAATLCQSTTADVAASVETWLASQFVPAYEAKAAAFGRICAVTEEALATAWQRLADVLTTVRADHFDTILDVGTAEPGPPAGATEPSATRPPAPSAPQVAPAVSGRTAGATILRKIFRRPKAVKTRRSLGICLPDGLFADLDLPEHDAPSAIGAPDDYRRYNDEPW